MTNLLYSAKHYQTKCAEDRKIVENLKNDAEILLKNAQSVAKNATFGNIGDIKYTLRTDIPNGGFWCDGSIKTQEDLPDVYNMLLQNKLNVIDIEIYNNLIASKGSCGSFGLDIANKSFRLPLLQDVYIKAGQEIDEFGAESLPNITGTWDCDGLSDISYGEKVKVSGALYSFTSTQSHNADGFSDGKGASIGIDASRSSSTYQNGAKVNPDHVKYRAYIILYAAEKEMSIVNWTNQLEKKTNESIAQIDAKADSYLDKTQITNCITEIPQDIKLELVDDRLVLKSGSKIRIPNGKNSDDSLKFDEFVIETDISCTFDNTNQKMVFFHPEKSTLWHGNASTQQVSGDIQPTISWGYWYDTKNNIIKHTNNGSNWTTGFALPLCLATGNDSSVTSIDQVFNGFGYIGSTVFVLPGVKVLIPNGRNADGSLKNREYTVPKVLTRTETKSGVKAFVFDGNIINYDMENYWHFDYDKNIYASVSNGATYSYMQFVKCETTTNGVITSFSPKHPFRAIDYNDKQEIIRWGVPDYNAIISVSSGFTAPSDGILSITYNHGDWANNSLTINNVTIFSVSSTASYYQGTRSADFYPLSKGDVVSWTNGGGKFIPFKGAK